VRKPIEEIFGWLKTTALTRKQRHRGLARARWLFIFAVPIYNLVRIRNLDGRPAILRAAAARSQPQGRQVQRRVSWHASGTGSARRAMASRVASLRALD
jgi:hypothetical protein